MTLLRQLSIVIVALFLLLFVGTFVIDVNNTKVYLNNQLRSISEDTATSLGLTLSPHMAAGETVIMESMVNAVFDGGYYREVTVLTIDGKPLIQRVQPITIEGIPQWFIDLFPLDTPRGEAVVMDGWKQGGTVRVSSNPGYAYVTLWNNSVEAFWWFLGAWGLTLALGVIALRVVLRPLRAVEAQAEAICGREYPVQQTLPRTLELRRVVEAMNRMTTKVKETFDEQVATIERMRAEVYRDPLTGLANRRYFDMRLKGLGEAGEHATSAALVLLELKDFKQFNERHGYQAGDELLCSAGSLIEQLGIELPAFQAFSARIAGADFAILLSEVAESDALAFSERLANGLPRLGESDAWERGEVGHIGVAMYHGQTASQLLAEADMALRAAQVKGANAVHLHAGKAAGEWVTYPASRWSEILQDALGADKLVLYRQPVCDCSDEEGLSQHEILVRLRGENDQLIPACVFVPMAKRLGLVQQIDRHVVQAVMARLAATPDTGTRLSVNLFPDSVADAAFVAWLCEQLGQAPAVARRLVFEVTEYGAVEHLDALQRWVDGLHEAGARTCLDHFGRGFASFGYLSTLKIDYLKIDGGYIRGIERNRENQFLVDTIVRIAHGLDIEVIAEAVETDAEKRTLRELHLDGIQGYGVGRPELW